MELRYPRHTHFILVAFIGFIFASFSYLIFIYDPVQMLTRKLTAFEPNSLAFYLWRNPPYEILVKINIHNVTNPNEFLYENEKLHIQEVRPYVYKEILYNINSTFNEDGTLSFTPKRLIEFVPELSVGDPNSDRVLTPNIPLLGMTATLEEYSLLVKAPFAEIAYAIDSKPFLNLSVQEYLYGYDDRLVTLANTVLPNWIDFPSFGIIDRLLAVDNATDIMTMYLDNEHTDEEGALPFSIAKRDGSPGLTEWGYKDYDEEDERPSQNSICNTVQGCFLGTVFPPHLKINTTIRLYRHGFCRPIPIKYESSGYTKSGFEGYTFRVEKNSLGTARENPENDCFCSKEECLPSGVSDLSACYYNIPIALSQPHFLNGDPMLLEQVEGLSPDVKKHDFFMVIHPSSGLPLEAKLRVQLNLHMPPSLYNMRIQPFRNLIVPLFWVELVVEAPPPRICLMLRFLYHILPIVQEIIKYAFAIISTTMICGSALVTVFTPKIQQKDYLELPSNYKEIEPFPITSKLLESEM